MAWEIISSNSWLSTDRGNSAQVSKTAHKVQNSTRAVDHTWMVDHTWAVDHGVHGRRDQTSAAACDSTSATWDERQPHQAAADTCAHWIQPVAATANRCTKSLRLQRYCNVSICQPRSRLSYKPTNSCLWCEVLLRSSLWSSSNCYLDVSGTRQKIRSATEGSLLLQPVPDIRFQLMWN